MNMPICRFCANRKQPDEIIHLASNNPVREDIKGKLYFLNAHKYVDLSSEQLPKTICLTCQQRLFDAHSFFVRVKSSQSLIVAMVGSKHSDVKPELFEDECSYRSIECEVKIELEHDTANRTDTYYGVTFSDLVDESDEFPSVTKPNDEDSMDVFDLEPKEETSPRAATSWNQYSWICPHCEKICPDMNALRRHTQDAHSVCSAFKCADCSVKVSSFNRFVDHVRSHRSELRCFCQYCNMQLKSQQLTALHISEHERNDPICKKCGTVFEADTFLEEHMTKLAKVLPRHGKKLRQKRLKKKPLPRILPLTKVQLLEDKTWTGYPWSCPTCSVSAGTAQQLREHTKQSHGACFLMRCADCPETFDCYINFVYHVRYHRPFLKKHCPYCNMKIEKEELSPHIAQHFSGEEKYCQTCGEILHGQAELQAHIATYKPATPKYHAQMAKYMPISQDDLTCDICSKILSTKHTLEAHKKMHTVRAREYTCEKCGKTFFTKSTLRLHGMVHQNTRYECDVCKRILKTHILLKNHMLSHSQERPYQCELCLRKFKDKKHLKNHAVIHTDSKPHVCKYCEKAFRLKTTLKVHLNQHTGSRPYVCPDCGMDFTNWGNCDKHMKRKHGTTLSLKANMGHRSVDSNPFAAATSESI